MTWTRRLEGEDGVAMVTAIMVSFVVALLSISAVSLAIHNTDASGYDRRRVMALDAAEAGIDRYYQLLSTTAFSQVTTATGSSSCVLTQALTTTPATSFTVTPTFYASDPDAGSPTGYSCPQTSPVSTYVKLSSAGSVSGTSSPVRTMLSKARLTLNGLSLPPAAIFANQAVALNANIGVLGNGANNADVYSNGDVSVTTQSRIYGNLYAQGSATISNGNFQLAGNLWAKNAVSVSGGRIGGSVTSSASTIAVSGNTRVSGDAKAGSTITVSNPAQVLGTQSPNTPGIANPPSLTYPTYTYNSSDWPGIQTQTSCSGATTAISSWTSGDLYIRLTGCLSLTVSSKTLPGNLGILTDGSISFPSNTRWMSTTGVHNVYLFTGMAGTCGDLSASSNSGISGPLQVLLFTPGACTVTVNSNSWNASGQIFSGTVNFNSNTTMAYAPVSLPNGNGTGSYVDVVYRCEIKSTTIC